MSLLTHRLVATHLMGHFYLAKLIHRMRIAHRFGEQEYDEDGNPIDSIFNQDSIFVSGDFQVELITSNPDSIVVNITNLLTGEVTVVEIPRFG